MSATREYKSFRTWEQKHCIKAITTIHANNLFCFNFSVSDINMIKIQSSLTQFSLFFSLVDPNPNTLVVDVSYIG